MGKDTLTVHGFRARIKIWAEETTQTDTLAIEACMAHTVKGIKRGNNVYQGTEEADGGMGRFCDWEDGMTVCLFCGKPAGRDCHGRRAFMEG